MKRYLTGRVRRYSQFFRLTFCVGYDSRLWQLSILASERAIAMHGASRLAFNAYLSTVVGQQLKLLPSSSCYLWPAVGLKSDGTTGRRDRRWDT